MNTPNRLRDRRLELGRGRVYWDEDSGFWFADYRSVEGNEYGSWAETVADGHDWIREKATR